MEAVKIFDHKGLKIEIFQDENTQSPQDWGDDNVVFLVNYHQDFFVKNDKIITEDDLKNWFSGEKILQQKEYHIFPLSMLSHSGIWLSLINNFISDPGGWDTSCVGAVLVSKKESKTKKQAQKMAQGLVKTWNDYLSGNVYGYMVDGQGGCWGFYGDIEKSGIIEAAKEEAETMAKEIMQKHLRKLKAQILNGVSLDKREALSIC